MNAYEINRCFLSLANWVDPEKTVDRVIIGDGNKEIRTILVTWMCDVRAIDKAVSGGFDMIMTHEPTFWLHGNERSTMESWAPDHYKKACALEKKQKIEANGLVVLRNHDVWDRFPNIGIPWAWAEALGFSGMPVATGYAGYQHRYDIDPIPLSAFAARVSAAAEKEGEPAITYYGNENTPVSKIGIGTGCACDLGVFREMGCDAAVVVDDGSSFWRDICWAMDEGFPVVRVSHRTSEEPGMRSLTRYINENMPGLRAEYFTHHDIIKTPGR